MTRGLFIAFEGGEACGKSTQARLLAEKLDALLTREPGGTPFGERVREIFQLDTSIRIDPKAEALLVASARAQHVAELIEPTLTTGRNVVTDRFIGSSLAYQGYGRGLDLEEIEKLSLWATGGVNCDLTFLIDVPLEVALARRGGSLDANDRFEAEKQEFHRTIADGYKALAASRAETWIVIDGDADVDSVFDRVYSALVAWQSRNSN